MIDNAINNLAIEQDATIQWEYVGFIENENDFNSIKVKDGKSFNFTWSDVQAKATELENEKQAKATDKANGNQKLLDLGLTQAEATALTGYTPPVAE